MLSRNFSKYYIEHHLFLFFLLFIVTSESRDERKKYIYQKHKSF
nr:hypothetical protein [Klebsiella michiganensis]